MRLFTGFCLLLLGLFDQELEDIGICGYELVPQLLYLLYLRSLPAISGSFHSDLLAYPRMNLSMPPGGASGSSYPVRNVLAASVSRGICHNALSLSLDLFNLPACRLFSAAGVPGYQADGETGDNQHRKHASQVGPKKAHIQTEHSAPPYSWHLYLPESPGYKPMQCQDIDSVLTGSEKAAKN
jgi:hypothetical protein